MKKDMKDNLKKLNAKELMEKLQELETELFRMRTKVKNQVGYPKVRPEGAQGGYWGNLQRIRKDIARIKTWLNIKLKNAT